VPEEIDPLTLARYLSGELGSADMARVRAWIEADPSHRDIVDGLRAAWEQPAVPEFDPDDVVWRRIAAQMDPAAPRAPAARPARLALSYGARPPWAAIAAAVVIAVGIGATLVLERPARATVHETPLRVVTTRRGQTAALELADGTRVTLGPESRLTIPEGMGAESAGSAREVVLAGEGYFVVRHDAGHPFRVRTASGIAEDVGTALDVAAYPETHGMQVVVAEGVVALRPVAFRTTEVPLATLARGALGRIDSAGTTTVTRGVRVADYLAWTSGGVVFDATPLRDAIPMLARTYDLDIRLADSALGRRRVTAAFSDAPASRMLELLAMAVDLKVERIGTAVILHPARLERTP
jgi:transmembrane sensor